MGRHEQFAGVLCEALAEYSYAADGVTFIGWRDLDEAAGDLLDAATGTLTLEPYNIDGGMARLEVPQFELGDSLTAQKLFSIPVDSGEMRHAAEQLAEGLVKATGRKGLHPFDFDVALSFASEQREYVRAVYKALSDIGIQTFFDEAQTAEMWGRDGVEMLTSIYGQRALFTVMFISDDYVRKAWPTVERRAALSTVLADPTQVRVLPVRFDHVDVPGMPASTFYVPAENHDPSSLADLIAEKLRESGYVSAASAHRPGKGLHRARQLQFRSTLDYPAAEGEPFVLNYRIHNGSAFPVSDVVVVVADPYSTDCDSENQVGNAAELIIGSVGSGETIEDQFQLRFPDDDIVFSHLTRLGGVIWSDHEDQFFFANGAEIRRKPHPPRLC